MSQRKRFQNYTVQTPKVVRGKVTRVSSGSIFVSSPNGLKEFQVDNAPSYKVGDTVRFQGNTFIGRAPSEDSGRIVAV